MNINICTGLIKYLFIMQGAVYSWGNILGLNNIIDIANWANLSINLFFFNSG